MFRVAEIRIIHELNAKPVKTTFHFFLNRRTTPGLLHENVNSYSFNFEICGFMASFSLIIVSIIASWISGHFSLSSR